MSEASPTSSESQSANRPRVNDVTISVATSNGTGSQSANLILMRSIFNMGIPVGAKNMFPSNIQGLPTWFTVRASAAGWSGRRRLIDLCVAMNEESVVDDIAQLPPGATLVLHKSLEKYAQELGLDMGKFKSDLDSGKYKARIDSDMADAGKVGIGGTPSFLINGKKLIGAQPYDAFKAKIEAALAGK